MFYPQELIINNRLVVHNDPRPDPGFYAGHYAPIDRASCKSAKNDYILLTTGLVEYQADLGRIKK